MTDLELKRLQRGQTLQNKIEKVKSQIKSLEDVTYIMLGTTKEKAIFYSVHPFASGEKERIVNFNIPLNTEDKVPHPLAGEAKDFIAMLRAFLLQRLTEVEQEFNEL